MTIAPTDADAAWTVAVSDQPPVVTRAADPDAHPDHRRRGGALYPGCGTAGTTSPRTAPSTRSGIGGSRSGCPGARRSIAFGNDVKSPRRGQ